MSPALLLGIVVLGVVFVYARTVIRVDAPVSPPGVARIRRRSDFWLARGQNVLRYIVGIVIGLAVVWGVVRPNLSSGQTVGVSSQAGRSPVRADVVSTMNDYFADFDTGPVCRYASAFRESLRPPPPRLPHHPNRGRAGHRPPPAPQPTRHRLDRRHRNRHVRPRLRQTAPATPCESPSSPPKVESPSSTACSPAPSFSACCSTRYSSGGGRTPPPGSSSSTTHYAKPTQSPATTNHMTRPHKPVPDQAITPGPGERAAARAAA